MLCDNSQKNSEMGWAYMQYSMCIQYNKKEAKREGEKEILTKAAEFEAADNIWWVTIYYQ